MWQSNLESFAVDAEDKKLAKEQEKRNNAIKAKELKIRQAENTNRLASPVKHKVTQIQPRLDKPNPWIPGHSGTKSYNAKNKAGRVLANTVGIENVAPQQCEKIQVALDPSTMAAQNEVLSATVTAMEARMSVIENHLQECLLELKTERARSKIQEEENKQQILGQVRCHNRYVFFSSKFFTTWLEFREALQEATQTSSVMNTQKVLHQQQLPTDLDLSDEFEDKTKHYRYKKV